MSFSNESDASFSRKLMGFIPEFIIFCRAWSSVQSVSICDYIAIIVTH